MVRIDQSEIKKQVNFAATAATGVDNNSIFRDVADDAIKIKDNSGEVKRISPDPPKMRFHRRYFYNQTFPHYGFNYYVTFPSEYIIPLGVSYRAMNFQGSETKTVTVRLTHDDDTISEFPLKSLSWSSGPTWSEAINAFGLFDNIVDFNPPEGKAIKTFRIYTSGTNLAISDYVIMWFFTYPRG